MSIAIEQPETLPALPEECQEVYFPQVDPAEMNDHEIKKLVSEIGNKIIEAAERPARTADPAASSKTTRTDLWLKVPGVIVSSIVILGAFYGMLTHVVSTELRQAFEQPNRDFASLRDKDLGGLRKDFDYLRSDVNRLLNQQAAALFNRGPEHANADDIKNAAKRLREARITVPAPQVERLSTPLFGGKITPAKWDAITELLNLRSFVNSTLQEARLNVVQRIGPSDHGKWFMGKAGEWTEVAIQRVILDGKDGELDVMMDSPGHPANVYKYLIFKNSHIVYRGGKITLVNVFFDNCTFEITEAGSGQQFAKAVLAANIVSFSET